MVGLLDFPPLETSVRVLSNVESNVCQQALF